MPFPRDFAYDPGYANPAQKSVAVTPADTDLVDGTARGLYVGGAGNVTIMNPDGTTVQFVGVLAGTWMPVMCRQVRAATTATSIVALF